MAHFKKNKLACAILPLSLMLSGCGDDDIDPNAINAPETYDFRSIDGSSNVNYREATTRLILIQELYNLIGSDYLAEVGNNHGKEQVLELLNRVYIYGTKDSSESLLNKNLYTQYLPEDASQVGPSEIMAFSNTLTFNTLQTDYSDLEPNINLQDAMPGISRALPNTKKDTPENGDFLGWFEQGIENENELPDYLIQLWFTRIAEALSDSDDTTSYVNLALDYRELIISFLNTNLSYSEAIKHLSISVDNLDNLNTAKTHLDLAFGYLGASKHYLSQSADDIETERQMDNNNDNVIDLLTEYNFPLAIEAKHRDAASPLSDQVFANKIMGYFLISRSILNESQSQLDNTMHTEFIKNIAKIKSLWESLYAANYIHHLKEIVDNMEYYGYDNATLDAAYGQSWAQTKGYALAFQYSDNSTLTSDELGDIHFELGQAPEMDTSRTVLNNYANGIYGTLSIVKDAFGFSSKNTSSW